MLDPGPRGVLYDREHRILAGNRLQTAAVLYLGDLRAEFLQAQSTLAPNANHTAGSAAATRLAVVQRHLDRINALTGRMGRVDAVRLERAFARERMSPFVLLDDLNAKESARLAAALAPDDPVRLDHTWQRWYPYGRTAAHVLGRVRRERMHPPNRHDLATQIAWGTVGDSGLEKQLEARLQGRPGESIRQVDAWGFPVDPLLARREPGPGEDVILSLDLDLQLAAERAMDATPGAPRGAAVAIAVGTGEVLALASRPDFDLSAVSPGLTAGTKQRIDAEGGWFNRAIQGLYAPGSTFKIFTAIAGLRGGTLHPDDVLRCDGFYDVAGHRFPCHNATGHGALTLRTALAQSCNVFAYQAGLAAGPGALAAEARRFHFDEPTGIEWPFETRQMLVPDPERTQEPDRRGWTGVDTANLSIGQGTLRYSPLQAACAIASLARRETLTVPTLFFQKGRRPTGGRAAEPLGLADRDYVALIEGLQAVVRTGIGQDVQVPGVEIAGKSGTAQVVRPEGMMNVAWFVAFAPVDRPEIAIAVAMEGHQPGAEFTGAEHAAPIVREIIAAYFEKRTHR